MAAQVVEGVVLEGCAAVGGGRGRRDQAIQIVIPEALPHRRAGAQIVYGFDVAVGVVK